MCLNLERMIEMFSKELAELDKNTVQYMIDEMQDKIDEKEKIIQSMQEAHEKELLSLQETQKEKLLSLQEEQEKNLLSLQEEIKHLKQELTKKWSCNIPNMPHLQRRGMFYDIFYLQSSSKIGL